MNQNIRTAPIIRKGLFVLLLLFLNYTIFSSLCQTVFETINEDDRSYTWNHLHESAAKEDYSSVREDLNLYELYEEEYDGLWNAADAYWLFCLHSASTQAAALSTDPDFTAQCKENAELVLTQLLAIPENSGDKTADQAILRIKQRVP